MRTISYLAVVLGLALTLGALQAQAETTNCTPITTVPTIITVQGTYCFTQHLNTSQTTGAAIDIQTNNVILDLNGWKLGGLAAGTATRAYGIYANSRQNITIKNGTVRGFLRGIFLEKQNQGHVVEDIRVDQNTLMGMDVQGHSNLIRNNQVVATGGTTSVFADSPIGIRVIGTGPRVLNNAVIDTQGIDGNATGILFEFVSGGLAVNNRITNADVGIEYAGTGTSASTGKYRDNLTFDVTTPFVGGLPVLVQTHVGDDTNN